MLWNSVGEEKEKRGSVWGLDFEIRNREIDQRHPVRLSLDSSPVFLLPFHYREILYCLFVRFASLFSTTLSFFTFLFLSFSLLIESAIRYPRRRAVYRSAPPVFQPSLPTPRTNILWLSATSTPHRSFLCVVWTSSFSTPACSIDKDRRDGKRRPTVVGGGWRWV